MFIKNLNLCSNFFSDKGKLLDRKLKFISKFVTLQPGKQTVAIHILHNISRSRGNKTMKFCQLIEYNVRIFFSSKKLCVK